MELHIRYPSSGTEDRYPWDSRSEVEKFVKESRETPTGFEIILSDVTHFDNVDEGMGISFRDGSGYTVAVTTPAKAVEHDRDEENNQHEFSDS